MALTREEIEKRWPEYLYRELNDPEQAQFAQYIHNDSACRQEEREWRVLLARFDAMAADETLEVPPELVFRVKRQVRFYQDWNRQLVSQTRKWTLGAAAAIFLAICSIWLSWQQWPQLTQQIHQPWRETVLSIFYNAKTLEMYKSEGLLEAPQMKTKEPFEVVYQSDTTQTENTEPKKPPQKSGKESTC